MLRNYKMNKYTISQHILVHNRVDYVILLRFYEGSHLYNIFTGLGRLHIKKNVTYHKKNSRYNFIRQGPMLPYKNLLYLII